MTYIILYIPYEVTERTVGTCLRYDWKRYSKVKIAYTISLMTIIIRYIHTLIIFLWLRVSPFHRTTNVPPHWFENRSRLTVSSFLFILDLFLLQFSVKEAPSHTDRL